MTDIDRSINHNNNPILWVREDKQIPSRFEFPESLPETNSSHWYDFEFAGWGEKKINMPISLGNGPAGKKITCLIPDSTHPYYSSYIKCMREVAEAFNINLKFKISDWSSEDQEKHVYETIEDRPDLIIFIPINSEISTALYRDINKAGIPVIASNLFPDSGAFKYILSWTGPDDWLQNRKLATEFANVMDRKGGYGIVCHYPGSSAFYSRKWAVITELKEIAPDMKVLAMGSSNLNIEESYNLVKLWIEKYGEDLKGIYCSDDDAAQKGVNKALKYMEREDIKCVAIGSTNAGIKMVKDGILDAITFQSPNVDGVLPIQVAVDWFNGLKISPFRYLPVHILTRNNISDFVFNYSQPYEINMNNLSQMIIECNCQGVETFFLSLLSQFSTMGVLSDSYFRGFSIELLSCLINITKTNDLSEKQIIGDYETIFKKLFNQQTIEKTFVWLKEVAMLIITNIKATIILPPTLSRQIVEYVDENFKTPISLKIISYQFDNSATYIGRLFKEETGQCFSKYLNLLRIKEAKNLLINTADKANKIAKKVGYGDANYFYITFKKYTGINPSEYAQSIT